MLAGIHQPDPPHLTQSARKQKITLTLEPSEMSLYRPGSAITDLTKTPAMAPGTLADDDDHFKARGTGLRPWTLWFATFERQLQAVSSGSPSAGLMALSGVLSDGAMSFLVLTPALSHHV